MLNIDSWIRFVLTELFAVVLLAFGSGSIKGFAITLLIGVLLSMFTAVVVTRYLLARLVGMRITNVRLYGLNEKKTAKKEDVAV